MPPCHLRLTLPEGTRPTSGEEMARWIFNDLTPQQIADSLAKVYELDGRQDTEAVDQIRKYEDGGFPGYNARKSISSHMTGFGQDLKTLTPGEDGRSFELQFDPAEWTKDGQDFYSTVSGRLYWLAACGALEHFGFQVEGTGL